MRNRTDVTFREVIIASRPLWWITMGVPFIVGGLLAQQEITILLIIGALYFLFPYNLLVYGVNDIFDYETDIRNERKSGVAHGKVLSKLKHPSLWKWIIGVNLPFIIFFLLAGNIESTVFLIMIIFMAFAYSVAGLRYKEIPVIDSLTSAFHYTSPFLFGLLFFSSPDLWGPWFAAFYFWAVGNHAFGAIQDIVPDKEAGIKSIATQLGATNTLIFCVVAYVVAALAPFLAYGTKGLFAAAWIAPYLITILSTVKYRKIKNASQFKAAWRRFLTLNYVVGAIGSMILIYMYNR